MIKLQIVERPGAELRRTLVEAMRSGRLRTFHAAKRGRKITHTTYSGYMNWSDSGGLILCEIKSPQKPGAEWQLLGALVGRLADRYAGLVQSITIQFPDAASASAPGRRKQR